MQVNIVASNDNFYNQLKSYFESKKIKVTEDADYTILQFFSSTTRFQTTKLARAIKTINNHSGKKGIIVGISSSPYNIELPLKQYGDIFVITSYSKMKLNIENDDALYNFVMKHKNSIITGETPKLQPKNLKPNKQPKDQGESKYDLEEKVKDIDKRLKKVEKIVLRFI